MPDVLPDSIVDSLENGEIDVLFRCQRQVLFLDDFFPLFDGEPLSFTFLPDEQEPLDVHVLDPFLLPDGFVVGVILKEDEVLAGRLFEDLGDDDFE